MENDLKNLILSYDRAADERDKFEASDWKKDMRWKFLATLKTEDKSRLIDIGAGTGIHGKFFQEQGINVSCVDLSPAHVEKCIKKGLESYVLDVLELTKIDTKFDCAFALNSLLHIPLKLLPDALSQISKVLIPDGLFFWGQYGGDYREGVYEDDNHEPKRFFSLLNDEQINSIASQIFIMENFEKIILDDIEPIHFQSMLLRVKSKQ